MYKSILITLFNYFSHCSRMFIISKDLMMRSSQPHSVLELSLGRIHIPHPLPILSDRLKPWSGVLGLPKFTPVVLTPFCPDPAFWSQSVFTWPEIVTWPFGPSMAPAIQGINISAERLAVGSHRYFVRPKGQPTSWKLFIQPYSQAYKKELRISFTQLFNLFTLSTY